MTILEISRLTKRFGGLNAVGELDLQVDELEIRGIIGPNGAGKTTLFNVITGVLSPTEGKVTFKGEDVTKLPVHERVKRGITRTFQITKLFADLTVYENVYIGYHHNNNSGPVRQFLHSSAARREEEICSQRTKEILEFMGLASLKDEVARNLPYGHQRAVALSIALATRPTLLLLDEPVAGMNPKERADMLELIRKIRETGITIMIVEHDMWAVMNLCDRISVLDLGKKIAEGTPQEIPNNKKVIEAYLGSEW